MSGGELMNGIKIKGEWYFQYDDGPVQGPFSNTMTTAGLERIATLVKGLPAVYIAMGDSGGEVFRKAVGAVVQSGAILRFRTTLSLTEGNGTHTWIGVFSDATAEAGNGIQINELTQTFNKTQTQVLNVECRFTLQQGVA